MRVLKIVAALAVLVSATGFAAQEKEPGDPKFGLEYARAHCAQCHEVESDKNIVPQLEAPSFPELANTPGMTARALVVALQTSHTSMPNFALKSEDRDNVVAYIMSLRTESP